MCVYEYMHICLYGSDFRVGIFLCTNNMHFSKCVYAALSLNPYISTLSNCHSRDYGLHFMHGGTSEDTTM